MEACKNCAAPLQGPFCSQCSQKNIAERLSVRKLPADLLANVTNLERGFLYSSWPLGIIPTPSGCSTGKAWQLVFSKRY